MLLIDLSQSCWLPSSLKSSNFDEDTASLNFTSILLTTLNISKKVKSCVITTTKWNIIRFMVDTRHCIICLNLGYPIRLSCVRFQRLLSCFKHPLYDNIFGHLNFICFDRSNTFYFRVVVRHGEQHVWADDKRRDHVWALKGEIFIK